MIRINGQTPNAQKSNEENTSIELSTSKSHRTKETKNAHSSAKVLSEEDKRTQEKNWANVRDKALASLGETPSSSKADAEVVSKADKRKQKQNWANIRAKGLASLASTSSTPNAKNISKETNISGTDNAKDSGADHTQKTTKPDLPKTSNQHHAYNELLEPASIIGVKRKRSEMDAPPQTQTVSASDSDTISNTALEASDKAQSTRLRQIAGRDGFFYFLTSQGNLHRYDPTVDEVLNTGLKNVSQFTMGADGEPYALIDNRIARMNLYGTIKEVCTGTLNIHSEARDIAVSPLGRMAFLLNQDGQLFTQDLKDTKPLPQLLNLPVENTTLDAHSVAVGSEGSVWLLGKDNQVWKGNLTADNKDQQRIQWQPISQPNETLLALETLADGTVSGRNDKGEITALHQQNASCAAEWRPIPFESLTQSAFQRTRNALNKQNPLELITFLGGTATARAFSKDTLRHPAKALGNVAKSIPKLFRDLKHFDYKKQQKPSFERFHSQVNKDIKIVREKALPPYFQANSVNLPLFESKLGKGITEDSLKLLNNIDVELDQHPKLSAHYQKTKNNKEEQENVLNLIKNARISIYGAEDSVVQKLETMLGKGLFISKDISPYQGPMAKLLTDHATLITTMGELSIAPEDKAAQVIQHNNLQRNEALPNLLARSGVADTDPFGKAAQGFDGIQAIFRQKNDMLNRIIDKYSHVIDGSSSKSPLTGAPEELFPRLLHTMKPGDTISFGKGSDTGFNTDSLRLAFSGSWASLTGGQVSSWAIPIVDFGKLKDVDISLSKTKDGLNISVNRSRGEYLQIGARTGVGVVELPDVSPKKVGTAWGFQGWEIAIKDKHSRNQTDSINLTLKDKGNGNLHKVITDIMTGQADLFELMHQATESSVTHKAAKAHNLGVGNVGVLAGGITMPGWNEVLSTKHSGVSSLLPVGKVLGALVPEIAADFGSKQEVSKETNSHGRVTESKTEQKFGLQSIRGNMIGVGNFESDFLGHALPGDMMLGEGESNPGVTGRAGIPSILPGAILGKSFAHLAPTSKTVTMISSPEGRPESIHVKLNISRTSTLAKNVNKYQELSQVPGLKQAINTLTHQQGKKKLNFNLPVAIELELKPEQRNSLPVDKQERKNALTKLAKDLNNFRMVNLSVVDTRQEVKAKALPIPAFTRSMKASMSASSKLAKVNFIHDKNTLVRQAERTIKSMAAFSEAAWGTKDSQQRLTQLKQRLENLVDALGQSSDNWQNGQDLQKNYQQQFNALKNTFMQQVHNTILNKLPPEEQKQIASALLTLSKDTIALRKQFNLAEFEGPAVISSGPLFTNPYVGKMQPESRLKAFKDISLTDTIEQIKTLSKKDLSSLKGAKLDKEKHRVNDSIGNITRLLGNASDIDPKLKQAFLAELHLLPARPSTPTQLTNLLEKLEQLAARS